MVKMQAVVSNLSFKGVINGVIGFQCLKSLNLRNARAKVQKKFTNNNKMALKSRSLKVFFCDFNFDFGVSEKNCEYSKLYCQYWKENILSKIQIK